MPLTVGTAGHIDHGKTWLVRALTGKDTDRLPEEQERGISIELGYAPLDLGDGRARLARRRPGPRAFRADDGRRRDRDRPLPARDRRRRGRPAADARAPRDPAPAWRRAWSRRGHEGRCGRPGDARTGTRRGGRARPGRGGRRVSAKTGEGLDELRAALRGSARGRARPLRWRDAPVRRPRVHADRDRDRGDRDALVGLDLARRRAAGRAGGPTDARVAACRCTTSTSRAPRRAARRGQPARDRAHAPGPRRRACPARPLPGQLAARRRARGARADPGGGDRSPRDERRLRPRRPLAAASHSFACASPWSPRAAIA